MNLFQRNAKKIVVVAVISGAASVIFIRPISTDPFVMGFFRLAFSLPFFAVPVILSGRKGFSGMTGKDFGFCALAGLFLFAHFTCWFTAVDSTSVARASVLAALHPLVILTVQTVWLKQRTSLKVAAGIFVALFGGGMIAASDYNLADENLFGDVAAFFSAIFFGMYFLMGKKMRVRVPAVNYVFLVFSACWVFFALAVLFSDKPLLGYPAQDYLLLFGMALVCQVGAHALYNWCMGYASSLYVSVWVSGDPVFATLFAFFFFGETPGVWQYLGGAIAISGLLYYNYQEAKLPGQDEEEKPEEDA